MALTLQPTFGSFVYATAYCEIESWNDEIQVDSNAVNVPRSDIGRTSDEYVGSRIITINGIIGDESFTTRDDLRTAEDAFRVAHLPGVKLLYRDSDRKINAAVQSVTIGEDSGLLWIPFVVRFHCADPYYYSTSSVNAAWPSFPANLIVNNSGSANLFAGFNFTAGSTATLTVKITNSTVSGAPWFQFSGDVVSGQQVNVDCNLKTCTNNGVNAMANFTGEFFHLQPGNNTLTALVSAGSISSVAHAYTLRWL